MMQNVSHVTLGEAFLLDLSKAESKGLLFAVLENFTAEHYSTNDLLSQIKKVSDFYSVAAYHNKLARIRIDYNAKAVDEISKRLVGLNNFGNDNYKYKEKIVRKLNLLINNLPTLEDLIYITMASYVDRGYGAVADFKTELAAHISDNISKEKLSIECSETECRADFL